VNTAFPAAVARQHHDFFRCCGCSFLIYVIFFLQRGFCDPRNLQIARYCAGMIFNSVKISIQSIDVCLRHHGSHIVAFVLVHYGTHGSSVGIFCKRVAFECTIPCACAACNANERPPGTDTSIVCSRLSIGMA